MANTYSNELSGIASQPVVKPSALSAYNAREHRFRATIPLTSQASGDTVTIAKIPAGMTFAGGVLATDTSLGTATVAVGISGTTGKYAAAQTLTATNSPVLIGTVAQLTAAALTAEETIIVTVGVASLPASGTLLVDLYFSHPN